MYKRALGTLLLFHLLLLSGIVCVTGVKINRIAASPAFWMKLDAASSTDSRYSAIGMIFMAASGQRVVDYSVLEEPAAEAENASDTAENSQAEDLVYQLDKEEYDLLLRIVEAEAGSEDEDGRLLVANVVFNRMNSEYFPDTVSEVILQTSARGKAQFSPVSSGRIWKVTVSEKTAAAVQRALEGEDISQGALYFAARKRANSSSMRWFDEKLIFLFQHGGHEFFTQ